MRVPAAVQGSRIIGLASSSAALLAAAVLVIGFVGCATPPGEDGAPPPLVLISIDTLRSDHLPAYGYGKIETPAIERLRRDGILFRNAYANVPLTFPSHASMLTGLLPNAHGVRDNLGYDLASERLSYLPRILREQGYATGAAVSSQSLRGSGGLAEGFDLYDDRIEREGARSVGEAQRPGGETLERALAWLDGLTGPQLFLFIHLYEPHTPYEPPEPFASLYASPYDGEIAAADAIVGGLLEALDERQLYEPAAIVLTSDHGEGLGDHGEHEHGILLYREALQVPLVLKLPRARGAGTEVATPAQVVDIFYTLAELGGAGSQVAQVAGVSLLSLIEPTPSPDRPIFAETFYPRLQFGWSDLAAVVVGPLHMIEGVERELYDLENDPWERADLERGRPADAERLARILGGYDRTFVPRGEADPATQRRLQALGYLISGSSPGSGELGDPKALIHTLEDLMTGMDAFRRSDYPAAESALRVALEQHPQLVDTWHFLAQSIVAQGRQREALEVYRQALTRTEGSAILAEDAVRLFVQLGHAEDALRLISAALERAPGRRYLQSLEVRLLLQTGRVDESRRRAESAVAESPEDAGAWYDLAIVARVAGDATSAERALRRTIELDPRHVNALNDLSVLVASRGDLEEAIEIAEQALLVAPGHALATENLEAFLAYRQRTRADLPADR